MILNNKLRIPHYEHSMQIQNGGFNMNWSRRGLVVGLLDFKVRVQIPGNIAKQKYEDISLAASSQQKLWE